MIDYDELYTGKRRESQYGALWSVIIKFVVIPSAAVLVMRTSPATGGDTTWSNCSAAYEDLSNGMKRLLEGRTALHDQGPEAKAIHPVVVAHPETGRPILFVNDIFTRGIMVCRYSEMVGISTNDDCVCV